MTKEIKEQLDAEIMSELNCLADADIETDTYKTTIECITKLIDKRNEMDKLDLELKKHELNEWIETKKISNTKEINERNEKNQLIQNIISISGILIPVFVTIWGTYKTLKFEETGTVTTIMGRGFINKLIPKK